MADTYTMPPHGWTCFHCGETFTTPGSARDHFGGMPEAKPGCMLRVSVGEERGLLMELRKAEVSRDEWERRAIAAEQESESLAGRVAEFERIAGGGVHELRMKLDSMHGRVITAEVLIEGFRRRSPEIFAEIIG